MTTVPRILVTQQTPEPAIELLRAFGTVTINPEQERVWSKEELIAQLPGHDCLLCMITNTVDAAVFDAEPKLKIVANMAVGYNNIDVAAATARRIPVTNTPGVLTETTADFAWALLLGIARRVAEADRYTRAGNFKAWGPLLLLGTDVFGKTLGIVGMGRIGQAIARRGLGFGMNVLYHNRTQLKSHLEHELHATHVPLIELLEGSDFVSLNVPYNSTTHHLIGAPQLAEMQPNAYLINTARGPVVDEHALVRALQQGGIAGAALDVFEREPDIEPELLRLDNVLLAPHIASGSLETRTRMATLAASNIIAVLKGQRPPNVVNPESYG